MRALRIGRRRDDLLIRSGNGRNDRVVEFYMQAAVQYHQVSHNIVIDGLRFLLLGIDACDE